MSAAALRTQGKLWRIILADSYYDFWKSAGWNLEQTGYSWNSPFCIAAWTPCSSPQRILRWTVCRTRCGSISQVRTRELQTNSIHGLCYYYSPGSGCHCCIRAWSPWWVGLGCCGRFSLEFLAPCLRLCPVLLWYWGGTWYYYSWLLDSSVHNCLGEAFRGTMILHTFSPYF